MTRKIKKYGWKPDLPDHRDHAYAAPRQLLSAMPPKKDLRPLCPPVLDQGELGSCTANAIANAFLFDEMKQRRKNPFLPSRLFVYYNERALEGTVDIDNGAEIRDGFKTIAQQGVVPETEWPYDISKFAVKPPDASYKHALKHQALSYQRLNQNLTQLKGCLASGYPFVFGITVFESFESEAVAKSGVVPMPDPTESSVGGHAILGVGYDDPAQVFIVQNSWSESWGQKGFFTIPYAYVTHPQMASDFWTLRTVE